MSRRRSEIAWRSIRSMLAMFQAVVHVDARLSVNISLFVIDARVVKKSHHTMKRVIV